MVDLVQTTAGLLDLGPEWEALEAEAPGATLFQRHAFVKAWWRRAEAEGERLVVVVVRQAGRAILILPLSVRGEGVVIGRIAGDPVTQYADCLARPGADVERALGAGLARLRQAGLVDALVLRRVREDSQLARAGGRLAGVGPDLVAPFIRFSEGETYADFLKRLSKSTRKGLAHQKRHLAAAGAVVFSVEAAGEGAVRMLAGILDLKRRWLAGRGEVSQVFLDAANEALLLDLARTGGSLGVTVATLSLAGALVAGRFGFTLGGRHYAYLTAYDPGRAELAAGKIAFDAHLQHLRAEGVGIVDLFTPGSDHKRRFAKEAVTARDRVVGLTPKGRAYVRLVHGLAKPAAKALWSRLPRTWRAYVSRRALAHAGEG